MATEPKRGDFNSTMIYVLTKAVHLVSVFVWIGGMVAVALSLRHPVLSFLRQLRSYDRMVTSPAMVAAWAFGILLAAQGSWFAQSWLALKILLVLILSGLHGVLAGKLRRATSGAADPEPLGHFLLPLGLVLVTLIVLVATFKP
ncbi:MAG: CopD family protein [Pseudomonadota bacterium]